MTGIRNPFAASFALALLLGVVATPPSPAWASDADAYVQSAQTLAAKGDLKGAAIELRNAARAVPENADIHFQLAKIYLQISNLPAAEAEARVALQRGADEAKVAPVLAEALLRTGKFDILLHDVPAGSRPPQQESAVRLFRGHAYISLGQLPEAETLMRDAERLDPNAVGPKLGVARLLLAHNELQEAERKIDQALAINPKDSHAEISKADVLRMRGDLDGGLAYLNDVLSREPQNFSAHLGRANLLVAKNQLDVAGQEIRAILAEVPDNFQANYLEALIDARQNRLDQANARLQKFVPEFRDFPVGFLLLGDVQFTQGKLSEAEDNLTKFLGRVPNNPMATRLVAEIATREGSPERAAQYLEALLRVTPNDGSAWVLLANAYLAEGKNDKASQALTHATATGTNDPIFQTELASTRYAAGETDQALQQLEQVFQQNGGVQIAGPSLILADLRSNRVSDAAAHAEAYVKANPNNPVALNLLGLARVAQTDLASAEKVFAGIYQQHSDFAVAGRNLAEVYIAQGRPDDAIAIYRDLVRRNAADVTSLMALSNVALANHDLAGAIDALKQAVNAAPNEPQPGLALARLYASQKDWNGAMTVMRGLLATRPNDLDVLDAMARMQIASSDLAGAVTTYRRATQVAPANAILFERYAATLVAANDLKNGYDAMRRAIVLDPQNISLKQEEVQIEYKIGGLAAAQTAAKSMMKPGDDPATVALWTATALAREGKVADASAILAAVEKTRPTQTVVLEHALILAAGGNAANGAALLKAWLDAHPDDVSARRELADLDLSLKDFAAAQAEYERLMAAFPNDVIVLNDLAWSYLQQGNPKARAVAERAHALAPMASAVEDTLGWVILAQGDAQGSLPYLRAASYGMPQDPNVQFHLAVALSRTGKVGDAREMLAKLANQDGESDAKVEASAYLKELGGH